MNASLIILGLGIGSILFAILIHLLYLAIAPRRQVLTQFGDWLGRRNYTLLPAFLVAMLAFIASLVIILYPKYSYKPAALPSSDAVSLVWVTVILTGIAFILTQVTLFVFPFVFRQRRQALFIKGHGKIELLWTVIPAICFVALYCWGQVHWSQITEAPASDAITIEVVAEQFNWKCRYGGADGKLGTASFKFISAGNPLGINKNDPASSDDFIPYQLHVPKGRQVNILLRSNDVIHSFYIPKFRLKMDAVPGLYTSLHFTAAHTTQEMRTILNDQSFSYEIACAELCGRMHFAMRMILVVDSQADFEKWYQHQPAWLSRSEQEAMQ